MGACRGCIVACLLVSFALQLAAGSNRFEDIALLVNATILNHTTQLENSTLYRYLSTPRTPVQYASSVNGLDLVKKIAADLENDFRRLGEVLQGTARQLEERYVDKRGVPCCYDNCHSSSCFSFCRENMSSLIKTYRRVPERDFSDSELKSHPNFEGGINISEVALHIPTNILEDGRETLCSLEWMDVLGDLFKSNWKSSIINEVATYQYFASSNGSMVYYPASNWIRSNICPRCPASSGDSYDARQRPWYAQTVQGSKYLVILLDMSGSMTGFRSLLARLAAAELLKSLTENDFFSVIRVDSNPTEFGCFSRARASRENILSVNTLITAASNHTEGTANFKKGFEVSFAALNASQECHAVMVIFADGDAEISSHDVGKYTTQQKVRIFSFQVGISSENQQLKAIATNNGGIFRQLKDYSDIFPTINDFGWELRRTVDQINSSVFFSRYRDTFGNLVLSLSSPVIHRGNNTMTLLGVMGIDVPLKTLSHTIHKQLGGTGYGFMVDNNGQLVTHPLLKEGWPLLADGLVTLDMERFEIPDQEGAMAPVRKALLNREVGNQSVMTWIPANRTGRTHYVRMNTSFYYAPVTGTSFSVAIAMPPETVLPSGNVSGVYPTTAGSVAGYIVLEDRPYCSASQLYEWEVDPITQPKLFLEKLSSLYTSNNTQCDRNLCLPLLADYATVGNISLMMQSEANESWFVQFPSGLTWCLHDGTNSTLVTCGALASTLYRYLVQGVKGSLLITGVDTSSLLVTPVNASSDSPAAVVGKSTPMLQQRLQQLLFNASNVELNLGGLFLLDSGGNVVASTSSAATGTELSTAAMETLVNLFTKVKFVGFELSPCSLRKITAYNSAVDQVQNSCKATAKDINTASSYTDSPPVLCYTNLTLYNLNRSSVTWLSSSPAGPTFSGGWAHLYGGTLLVAAGVNTSVSPGVGLSPVDVCSSDYKVYRVLPQDSICNATVILTGGSWVMLPNLSLVLFTSVLVLTRTPR